TRSSSSVYVDKYKKWSWRRMQRAPLESGVPMRKVSMKVSLACVALAFSGVALSQAPSEAEQAECSNIAVQQSGYNPANPPPAPAAQAAPVTGSGSRARGAAAGAAVGAIGGND